MRPMKSALLDHRAELEALCRRFHLQRLELFGSAATGRFLPAESDLDFVVEFAPLKPSTYADNYFDLLEALERLFGRPVALVVSRAIRNPYFRQSVETTKVLCCVA